MSDSSTSLFDVLVHTNELFIIQTHAGCQLSKKVESIENEDNTAYFGDFNLGLHVNDDAKQVLVNRGHLLASINEYLTTTALTQPSEKPPLSSASKLTDVDSIYWLNQTHSNQVVVIGEREDCTEDCREGYENYSNAATYKRQAIALTPPSADAMITNKPNTALAIMTADCVPIVLYDAASKQIATIHAGWHGLANGVIAQTVATFTLMQDEVLMQDRASGNLQAWIGACISSDCYEVSSDVVDKLLAGCQAIDMDIDELRPLVVKPHTDPNKAWLDLPTLAAYQLKQLNVAVNTYYLANTSTDNSINPASGVCHVSKHQSFAYGCSYSDDKYYSYRRATHQGHENTGRMAMIAVRL